MDAVKFLEYRKVSVPHPHYAPPTCVEIRMPVGRTGPVLGEGREKVLEVAKPVSLTEPYRRLDPKFPIGIHT